MSQQQYTPNRPQEEEIDLREEFQKYSRYWPAFVGSVVLCLLLAFLYLRYSTPIYQTTATIIIKDEKNGGAMSELAAFESLGLLSGMGTNSLENEMGILRSKQLMNQVVKGLQLNTQYFVDGNVRTSEVYQEKPVEVQLLVLDEEKLKQSYRFQIHENEESGIKLVNEET
ncbi:Wzz/FepE/Etk N-terminal domain-containing protein [Antarcticibacterium sp. 1MA-6-2]|uniref:Wzz/FepE/Etk N-terminal domain-containing protein n=1 Tax=Antarcticibacterium sp. 1MA-6-2 TaxID=2908210 RepID=UPI001F23532C|nr:Wzz/FepE/Etk N-terminal domain-containing protein [Antarcticibacterium sp. 1MA-6-2]UJH89855.1 Wzz/FepE/Etk N-terminal domain-containing protein [Antarcticibacterium sp. 1MA-6-2]